MVSLKEKISMKIGKGLIGIVAGLFAIGAVSSCTPTPEGRSLIGGGLTNYFVRDALNRSSQKRSAEYNAKVPEKSIIVYADSNRNNSIPVLIGNEWVDIDGDGFAEKNEVATKTRFGMSESLWVKTAYNVPIGAAGKIFGEKIIKRNTGEVVYKNEGVIKAEEEGKFWWIGEEFKSLDFLREKGPGIYTVEWFLDDTPYNKVSFEVIEDANQTLRGHNNSDEYKQKLIRDALGNSAGGSTSYEEELIRNALKNGAGANNSEFQEFLSQK
jgi:hypothetical protein